MASYGFCQCVFDREDLSSDEDVAIVTSHFRHVVEGLPDVFGIIQQTRDDYRDNWLSYWNGIKGHITPKITFREMRMYNVPDAPGGLLGDPVDIFPVNQQGGSGGTNLPPQIALSVTFKTDHRLRWGRFYLPGITPNNLDDNGRWDQNVCTDVANFTRLLTDRAGTGAALTVFSRKYWNHEDPQVIQVDDIPDVIRRRRFSRPIFKAVQNAS